MTKLEHALALAAKGFRVFPIAQGAKFPPLLNGWPQKATSDPEEIGMYWLAIPNANIGIHCEGLVVLDVDVRSGGNDALELLKLNDDLPATLCTNTPTGGKHLFYRLPADHSGVPNSASIVGKGIDVKSTGGYVLAPGSEVAAGIYTFEHDGVAIAAAPTWLLERCGVVRERSAPSIPIIDAEKSVVDRALEWLAGQPVGDSAYKTACGLRDLGLSEEQARTALQAHDGRAFDVLGPKVAHAYRYATGEAGARAALPEDFPVVDNSTLSLQKVKSTTGALTLAQFANRESKGAGYVVKGLLLRGSYAEVFGAPGEGKTFVGLDAGYHVAAGTPWMDRKVHAGPVAYLAYEGTGGLVKRAKALRQHYGDADVPLYIVSANFNLREKTGRQELGAVLAELPAKPVLIVIDTFARALMGGDENSAQDVGAFNTAIAALIESTGACVLLVHHSGKDKSKGARGSSALFGAIDTEIQVDDSRIIARKQRDLELTPPIGFKLVPVVVGVDEDGDEETSCVVQPVASAGSPGLERISGNAKRGFDVLCNIAKDNRPIHADVWRDACKEFLGAKSLAQRFYDIKKNLLVKGYVLADEKGMITRRSE
jgi:hypothetical protein